MRRLTINTPRSRRCHCSVFKNPALVAVFSVITLTVYTICFLKLWSYGDVNRWCRVAQRTQLLRSRRRSFASFTMLNSEIDDGPTSGTGAVVQYPNNLHMRDLYYFIMAPTLCYELNFPRCIKIRKRFLAKRMLEFLFLSQVIGALVQQWIMPLLRNTVEPFSQSEWSVIVERCLKLAIPNHLIWLMFFYVYFHSGLNVLAELLCFGDRLFYRDWWWDSCSCVARDGLCTVVAGVFGWQLCLLLLVLLFALFETADILYFVVKLIDNFEVNKENWDTAGRWWWSER